MDPIDLGKIDVPTFILSTKEDHIAPWKSTYTATQIYSGDVNFCLAGSGHIAGVVNPPDKNKYGYWTNNKNPATADEWFDSATQHEGSWWPEWLKWLKKYSGDQIAARKPGDGKLKVIEAAPGSYAALKIGSQASRDTRTKPQNGA